MKAANFIDNKSNQLVFFVTQFLVGNIPYDEIKMFIWDILEEWNVLSSPEGDIMGKKEEVFWHLLFILQRWSGEQLSETQELRQQLIQCCGFLDNRTSDLPMGCIGVRP